jgi:hypothetical protein
LQPTVEQGSASLCICEILEEANEKWWSDITTFPSTFSAKQVFISPSFSLSSEYSIFELALN